MCTAWPCVEHFSFQSLTITVALAAFAYLDQVVATLQFRVQHADLDIYSLTNSGRHESTKHVAATFSKLTTLLAIAFFVDGIFQQPYCLLDADSSAPPQHELKSFSP